MFDPLCLF